MRIAIDVGHSAVKVWGANDRHMIFPARIVVAPVTMDLGQVGDAEGAALTITEAGSAPVTYWVGERAAPLAPPLWSRDKAADPLTRALVYAGLVRMGLPDGPVGVGLGLPLAWYREGKDALRAALLGRRVTVTGRGRTHAWSLTAVRVLPQGASAALSVFNRGTLRAAGLYVIVDIGYRTTEYVVVEVREGRLTGRPEWSGMLDIGWSLVDDDAARRVSDTLGVTVWAPALTGDTAVVLGKSVELAPFRAPGVAQLGARITQAVQAHLRDVWTSLSGAVIIGGAASVVAAQLPWQPLPVHVPDAPAFANARGYWDAVAALPVPLDAATPSA
jgi:hypothetical protein